MSLPRSFRKTEFLKWIGLQTIALFALVVPSTFFLANCFFNRLGAGGVADPHATVRFITALAGVESALFAPIVAIPMSMTLRRLKDARERLQELADTDSLTGLLNRRGFAEAVQVCCRSLNAEAPTAALVVDIDGFKGVNDRHGHEFGDAVLRDLASLIGEIARVNGAIAARYGGEEFVIFAHGLPRHAVLALAVSLRFGFQARRVEFQGVSASCTISIGVANAVGPCDLPALIGRADTALYTAKRAGRNRVIEDAAPERRDAA
jgi:diguanylate cyclase (GGDEF)-like protein